MKTTLLAVGKVRERHLRALCDDYAARIRHFGPFEVVEVKDARGGTVSAIKDEGARLLKRISSTAHVVLLDEHGAQYESRQFARWMDEGTRHALRQLVFVLGGPHGHADDLVERSDERLSLSMMTLPHEMARLLLLEQLYRGWTILRGSPYHND